MEITYPTGSSAPYAKFVSATGVGNTADVNQDPLWTLTSIPAGSLIAAGDSLVLTLGLSLGATANNKAFGVTVDGNQINTGNVAFNGQSGLETIIITLISSTRANVILAAHFPGGVASGSSFNLGISDNRTTPIPIVVTGASPTIGAANDVKLMSGIAELKKG